MPYWFKVKPLYHSNLGGRLKQQNTRRMSGFCLLIWEVCDLFLIVKRSSEKLFRRPFDMFKQISR